MVLPLSGKIIFLFILWNHDETLQTSGDFLFIPLSLWLLFAFLPGKTFPHVVWERLLWGQGMCICPSCHISLSLCRAFPEKSKTLTWGCMQCVEKPLWETLTLHSYSILNFYLFLASSLKAFCLSLRKIQPLCSWKAAESKCKNHSWSLFQNEVNSHIFNIIRKAHSSLMFEFP